MSIEDKKLAESINRLSDILDRKSKAWRVFLSGVITGVGTVVGAALIGSLLVGIIASNLGKIPLIRNIIPQESIEQYNNGSD
jgi:hypothetical protein